MVGRVVLRLKKTSVRRTGIKKEDLMLIQVFNWIRENNLDNISWHTANERKTTAYSGQILKNKGVKSGVSDISCMRACGGYFGLYIELKVKPNKLTSNQKDFIEEMNKEGYYATVCWSKEEAIEVIQHYLALGKTVVIRSNS